MQFINREQEKKDLIAHLETEPNAILFLYGPKSCGKSTLLNKIIEDLDYKKYAINFLDLRQVIINNFQSFLDVFFQKSKTKKAQEILSGVTLNIGFFKVGIKDEEIFNKNSFKIIIDQVRKAKENGIQPVIIIDEIQELANIYTNENKHLLDELLNLFIALTKVTHLAHVVLATSDSCFIEKIYSNAKLSKTSKFYFIDHLQKEDIEKWLKTEGIYAEDIDYIWENLGGSPWEIQQVLINKQSNKDLQESVQKVIKDLSGQVSVFYDNLEDAEAKIFKKISKEIMKKGEYLKKERERLSGLLQKTVENDIWFYNASESKITANSKSLEIVFKEIF